MNYLSQQYPCLYMFMLTFLKKPDQLKEYIENCKSYKDDLKNYSLFIHGYLIPWYDQQRSSGKLKIGKNSSSSLISLAQQKHRQKFLASSAAIVVRQMKTTSRVEKVKQYKTLKYSTMVPGWMDSHTVFVRLSMQLDLMILYRNHSL